jgi:hypothetical protein
VASKKRRVKRAKAGPPAYKSEGVVWTGPLLKGLNYRQTQEVMTGLLRGAQRQQQQRMDFLAKDSKQAPMDHPGLRERQWEQDNAKTLNKMRKAGGAS